MASFLLHNVTQEQFYQKFTIESHLKQDKNWKECAIIDVDAVFLLHILYVQFNCDIVKLLFIPSNFDGKMTDIYCRVTFETMTKIEWNVP